MFGGTIKFILQKKEKKPSIFIYRSGSTNIVSPNMDLLSKAYIFINKIIKKYFSKIVYKKKKLILITSDLYKKINII